jgi:hypothetical protein
MFGAAIAIVAIVLLSAIPIANSLPFPNDTRTFTAIGPPNFGTNTENNVITVHFQMTYKNNANTTSTGVAYFVFRNALGQTSYWNSARISSATLQNALADFILTASVVNETLSTFVVSESGTALSNSTVIKMPA